MNELKPHFQKLVDCDAQIKQLNEQIKTLKQSKHDTEEQVKRLIINEQLQDKVFIINHKKITYAETKTYSAFTLHYLSERLNELVGSETGAQIVQYLKDHRSIKLNTEIKILDYNNE